MDMTKWIFQKDMEEWISRQPPISVLDQVSIISMKRRSFATVSGRSSKGKDHSGMLSTQ